MNAKTPLQSSDLPSTPVCAFCGKAGTDKWCTVEKEYRHRPPPAYEEIIRMYAHTAGSWECTCGAIGSGSWMDCDEAASLLLELLGIEFPVNEPWLSHLQGIERDHCDAFAALQELLRLQNYDWGLNAYQQDANSFLCTCLWVRRQVA